MVHHEEEIRGAGSQAGTLTSEHNAGYLNREVYIRNRIKSSNDSIYANVNMVHTAIGDKRQIRFRLCEWTVNKTLVQQRTTNPTYYLPGR